MATIHIKSTTALFLVFSALFAIAIAYVVDTDGNPLRNGGTYYIVPQSRWIPRGGLNVTSKSENTPCPLYITQEYEDATFPGIPVTITSPLILPYILPNSVPNSIVFRDTSNVCMEPMGWQVIPDETTGELYVATGGSEFNYAFKILKSGESKNVYEIDGVGIIENDGLLGINKENPLPVVFKKASVGGLAMKI